MTEPIAYLNGRFVPVSQASLHIFDLGIVGGASVTEMVRTFRHVPFLLEKHLARLAHSLQTVGFKVELSGGEIQSICEEVISQNARLIPSHHDMGMVVFVTAGQNLTYLGHAGKELARKATICVHTFPLPFELWADKYSSGIRLVSVPTRSIPDDVIPASVKHRSRIHWHLADLQAKQIDREATAILTDHDGYLTETATSNLCLVEGSTIVTPAIRVLNGISCGYVEELAGSLAMVAARQERITSDDLVESDEALLTSTPMCLLPVSHFNGRPIGEACPGPIFRKLIDAWSQSVGVDIIGQMQRGAAERQSAS